MSQGQNYGWVFPAVLLLVSIGLVVETREVGYWSIGAISIVLLWMTLPDGSFTPSTDSDAQQTLNDYTDGDDT